MFEDRTVGSNSAPDAIAALLDALRPLDHASTALLCAVSHQLRTPLTSIVGFAELLADGAAGPVTAQQHRLLETISRNAAHMLALVEELEPGRVDPTEPDRGGDAHSLGDLDHAAR